MVARAKESHCSISLVDPGTRPGRCNCLFLRTGGMSDADSIAGYIDEFVHSSLDCCELDHILRQSDCRVRGLVRLSQRRYRRRSIHIYVLLTGRRSPLESRNFHWTIRSAPRQSLEKENCSLEDLSHRFPAELEGL